jgi:hypothetical protein
MEVTIGIDLAYVWVIESFSGFNGHAIIVEAVDKLCE